MIDDPDDHRGHEKAESIRRSMRDGTYIPPVFVLHMPNKKWPYWLLEGRHRYNAAHREGVAVIPAWVAHHDCFCLPVSDRSVDGPDHQESTGE